MTCAACVHSRPIISDNEDEGPILKCHRFPPTLIALDGEVTQVRPDADETCGEYTIAVPLLFVIRKPPTEGAT